ncbi:Uma2 family endonuclease [Streptacidiphilus rugosus]|uniref:Uma2 family endonuclease n=1 Tax=Streptacidiphilus rugosus TaxID=405783 RepID=UPI00056541D5
MTAVEQPTSGPSWDELLRMFHEVDQSAPEGCRAELIEGEILVTPPPDGDHETVSAEVVRQFISNSELTVLVLANKGLVVPGGRFIPDGTVCAREAFRHARPWAPPTGALLVYEVTSTRPDKDRTAKRRGYAAAAIPCYLLIDRSTATVTLFTEPKGADYRVRVEVEFGQALGLPKPFGFDLDTSVFE